MLYSESTSETKTEKKSYFVIRYKLDSFESVFGATMPGWYFNVSSFSVVVVVVDDDDVTLSSLVAVVRLLQPDVKWLRFWPSHLTFQATLQRGKDQIKL